MTAGERNDIIRGLAREQWAKEGEIEFDDSYLHLDIAKGEDISEGDDNGAYVLAWVWVGFSGTELDKEPDDDT